MLRSLAVLLTLCFANLPVLQSAPAPAGPIVQDQSPPPDQPQNQSQYQQQDQGPAYENYSPEQLDNLLSPVALYPDPLLAQLFVASTFPDQVEEAARYVRANGPNGVDDQNWDVSVRAIAHYPTVVQMMADKIDWTTSLGQAYVNQSTDVAASVQHLRHMARDAGNLASSQQQEVIDHDNYIAISPYQPEYIYVPVYDPAIIYYQRPYWGPGITFGVGYPIGGWLNLDFRWGYGGGWGGVYYTGWRQEGWGGGCWNCGWIGRSRGRINFNNNVYINNRYNNINVNRNVLNRNINANNLNRYNAVHRNVNYNNVQANNNRASRMNNGNNGRGGNASGNYGNNGRQSNAPGNSGNNGNSGRYGNSPGGSNRAGASNKIIDRNIDRSNPQIDQYRGRDNSVRNDRPQGGQQRPMPGPAQRTDNRPSQQPQQNRPQYQQTQQSRPQYQQPQQNRPQYQQPQGGRGAQSQMTQPVPHSYNPREGNFDPRASSQRGQASRQQAPAQQRSVPQPRAQSRQDSAPRGGSGGERRKP